MRPLLDTQGNETNEIEIGWHLARAQWGKGLASEGANELVRIGFEVDGVQELWAVTETGNLRSQAVACRIGMEHVGQTR